MFPCSRKNHFRRWLAAALVLRTIAERRRHVTGPDLPPDVRLKVLSNWLAGEKKYRAAAKRRWQEKKGP